MHAEQKTKGPVQPAPVTKYNDVPFTLLFLAHLGLIGFFAFTKGVDEISGKAGESGSDYTVDSESSDSVEMGTEGIVGLIVCLVVAILLSVGFLKLAISMGEGLIHTTMKVTIGLELLLCVVFAATGVIWGAVIYGIIAAITICYYKAVQDRIAFAGANLSIASVAVERFPTLIMASFLALLMNFCWMLLWALAMIGVAAPSTEIPVVVTEPTEASFDGSFCASYANGETMFMSYQKDSGGVQCPVWDGDQKQAPGCCLCDDGVSNYGYDLKSGCDYGYGMKSFTYFLMLVSFYWGSTVVMNVMHCVTAGTVAAWWFQKDLGFSPVFDSFKRAMTTSFGSICLGSLLVAILKATRQMLNEARKNKNAQMLICVIDCLLGIIEELLKIFNRYAFCFVAIYGHDFKTAGRSVFDLFKRLGWTTIINDDLIEMTLNIGSLGVAGLTALCGYLFSQAMGMSSDWATILAVVGGLFGFVMSGVCLSVVSSAVATIFVCFADAPQAFFQTHPNHAETLMAAWSKFHGDEFDAGNYGRYRV